MEVKFNAEVIVEEVDIRTYPDPIIPLPQGRQVDLAVGDLHANPVKLVRFLIKHGVLNMSAQDYAELCKNYYVIANIDQQRVIRKGDFNRAKLGFIKIMDGATFNQGARIIIIGDETQDRGFDYFMQVVYDKLNAEEVCVETDASNHGYEYLRSYEAYNQSYPPKLQPMLMKSSHARSTILTQKMIGMGCLNLIELINMTERAYKPTLRVFSYSIDESSNTLVFYKHAPAGLLAVFSLGAKWEIQPLLDLTDPNLKATDVAVVIDAINAKYQEHVTNKTVSTLVDPAVLSAAYDGKPIDCMTHPFEFILWNRNCANLSRPAKLNKLNIIYVHGHEEEKLQEHLPHIVSLDSIFGKVFCDPYYCAKSPTFVFTAAPALQNASRKSSDALNVDGPESALKKSCTELPFFGKENKTKNSELMELESDELKQEGVLKHH